MKIKHWILLQHCSKWLFALMAFGYLVFTIFIVGTAINPDSKFFNKYGSILFRDADYRKGAPLQIDPKCIAPYPYVVLEKDAHNREVLRTIPFFEGLKRSYFRRPLTRENYDLAIKEGRVVDFSCDSSGVAYYAAALSTDPGDKQVGGKELTVHIWPSNDTKSLQLFLPEILKALFCCLAYFFVYRVLHRYLKGKLEHHRILGVLAPIGLLIMLYYVLMFLLGFTATYKGLYYIVFNTPVSEFNMPMEIYGHPQAPFSILWLLAGLVITYMGIMIRHSTVKEPEFSESLEEMAEG